MDLRTITTLAIALTFPVITGSFLAQDAEKLFEKPLRLQDAQGDINVEIGHAAPFVADIDQDGKADLLVGQFGSGRLRIYKNLGSARSLRHGMSSPRSVRFHPAQSEEASMKQWLHLRFFGLTSAKLNSTELNSSRDASS